jgi:predicted HAD superfamily hydrolase
MKLYDRCLDILKRNQQARNSDKVLIWEVFRETGTLMDGQVITKDGWMGSVSTESIRRCRQKIQETHPELQADNVIQTYRKGIEVNFPKFVFDEEKITEKEKQYQNKRNIRYFERHEKNWSWGTDGIAREV